MHTITISNGTRIREMFYSDFVSMLTKQTNMFDEYTYDLLTIHSEDTIQYYTFYSNEESFDNFLDGLCDSIMQYDVAIVLQHCEYFDVVFVIVADD